RLAPGSRGSAGRAAAARHGRSDPVDLRAAAPATAAAPGRRTHRPSHAALAVPGSDLAAADRSGQTGYGVHGQRPSFRGATHCRRPGAGAARLRVGACVTLCARPMLALLLKNLTKVYKNGVQALKGID